ncbi:MAG: sensor domain-containing diguanylate cyclase [Pseudothermotoga sp.]
MVFLKKIGWILSIAICLLAGFYYKPVPSGAMDILFTLYAVLVASLLANNLNSMMILFTAVPYILYTQGTFSPLLVSLGVLLQIGRVSLGKRIYQALVFFATTAISAILASVFVELHLELLVFSMLAIFLHMFFTYLSGEGVSMTFDDTIYAMFFIFATTVFSTLRSFVPIFVLLIYPVGLLMYLKALSTRHILRLYESEHKRFQQFREKLATLIEMTNTVTQKSTVHESLSMIAETVSEITGYQYVLINILDRENNRIFRAAHHGLSQSEFERLRSNPPPIEYISKFMQERFRISNSYFVPEGALELPAEYVAKLLESPSNLANESDAWKPDDMLIIPVYNPSQDLVGYISVDAPIHGKRPSIEDVQIMELIASQVYKLLERSELYQNIVLRQPYDQHTLLLTHSAFLGALESECQKGQSFAVAIIDIDDLTKINSQYGHEVGDRIIEKIADILRNKTRKSDIASRYGGEEFAIILRNVSKSKAIEITDRILDEIRKIEETVKVTASAGIGVFPDHGSDYREIIKYALKALEIAKKSGKDRLMVL